MVRQYLQTGLRVSLNHKYIFALCTALQVPSYDFANSFPMHVVNSAPHSLRSTYRFIGLDAAWGVSSLGLLLALSFLLDLCLFSYGGFLRQGKRDHMTYTVKVLTEITTPVFKKPYKQFHILSNESPEILSTCISLTLTMRKL